MRRRHVLFNQRPNFHVPSFGAGPSTSGSQICPVCDKSLPEGVSAAQTHVNQCLGVEDAGEQEEEEEGSTDSETYEEYTWCNVTRVRATSMLSPEARASDTIHPTLHPLPLYYDHAKLTPHVQICLMGQ